MNLFVGAVRRQTLIICVCPILSRPSPSRAPPHESHITKSSISATNVSNNDKHNSSVQRGPTVRIYLYFVHLTSSVVLQFGYELSSTQTAHNRQLQCEILRCFAIAQLCFDFPAQSNTLNSAAMDTAHQSLRESNDSTLNPSAMNTAQQSLRESNGSTLNSAAMNTAQRSLRNSDGDTLNAAAMNGTRISIRSRNDTSADVAAVNATQHSWHGDDYGGSGNGRVTVCDPRMYRDNDRGSVVIILKYIVCIQINVHYPSDKLYLVFRCSDSTDVLCVCSG